MEITITSLLIVCPLVFLAGIIDSISGGGGLITIPAYLAAGLPPHFALGTNKFSSSFGTLFATLRYAQKGHLNWRIAYFTIVAALIGSFCGARLTLIIEPTFLKVTLLILLPIILIIVLIKKDFIKTPQSSIVNPLIILIFSILATFLIGAYDGFFGPGTGTFLFLVFVFITRLDVITATGNAKIVNLASNVAAVITFIAYGKVNYMLGFPAAICGIMGNWIGSGLAIKKGIKVIRPAFIIATLLLLAKLTYDFIKF